MGNHGVATSSGGIKKKHKCFVHYKFYCIFVIQLNELTMTMILRLTKAGSDRSSLVNMSNTETSYSTWDKELQRHVTKICYRGNESFVMVEETPQEILKLVHNYELGRYQETDWVTKSIEEHLKRTYDTIPKTVFTNTEGW